MTDFIGHSPIAFGNHEGKVILRSLIADCNVSVPMHPFYAIGLASMLLGAAMEELKAEELKRER